MCSACRFCLSVYFDLSPLGMVHTSLLLRQHSTSSTNRRVETRSAQAQAETRTPNCENISMLECHFGVTTNDQKVEIRKVQALLSKERSEERQTQEPRHIRYASGR